MTASAAATSPDHDPRDIIPRDLRFDIPGNATRRWFADDLVKTATIDGLSIFLPEGERFFIRALKHYANKLDDKTLAKEINGYAVQEAFHTREHESYNKAMASLGYPVARMEKIVGKALGIPMRPIDRLAVTCAIEHLTATFSTATLRYDEMLEGAHPAYRRLWTWHALEELEHKAVALDVLAAATRDMSGFKRYWLRIAMMNATVIPFLIIFLRNVRLYVRADGEKTGPRFWWRFLKVMFGRPGYLRLSLGPFFSYYKPGFDPKNVDDSDLVAKGRAWLATNMPESTKTGRKPPKAGPAGGDPLPVAG